MYAAPPRAGALRQGEIIGPVWEHRVIRGATDPGDEGDFRVVSNPYARLIVMTNDCDLDWDFDDVRRSVQGGPTEDAYGPLSDAVAKAVPHVLLCMAESEAQMIRRLGTAGDLKRARSNQNPRYHALPPGTIISGEPPVLAPTSYGDLEEAFLDFKRPVAFPTQSLYDAIWEGSTARVALLTRPFFDQALQRMYAFLGRVVVP